MKAETMTAQHTPAPWKVRHTHQYGRYEVRGPGDTFTGQPHGAWICGDANEANAHLIATAPTMLAALREMVREWDEPYYGNQEERADRMFNVIEKLRPIIAQAEGRT
jgi:hypothetical protein